MARHGCQRSWHSIHRALDSWGRTGGTVPPPCPGRKATPCKLGTWRPDWGRKLPFIRIMMVLLARSIPKAGIHFSESCLAAHQPYDQHADQGGDDAGDS